MRCSASSVSSGRPGGVHIAMVSARGAIQVQPCGTELSTNSGHHRRNCAGRRSASGNAQLHTGSSWNATEMVSAIASRSSGPATRASMGTASNLVSGSVPSIYWFHSIDVGDHVTPGQKPTELLAHEWDQMRLPPLAGKSVLDIGAWDGYFSFRAEEAGAARVVALDHYVWSMHLDEQQAYYRACKAAGVAPDQYHERPDLWDPVGLPGKAGFDTARRARNSNVEPVVGDFMTVDADALGSFDVVFFLGVLYHLEEPLTGLRR